MSMQKIFTEFKKAAKAVRAINNPLRQRIINKLDKEGLETTVTGLYVALRTEQSVMSMQLSILRNAGIVSARRSGKEIYYSLNKTLLLKACAHCQDINETCKPIVNASTNKGA